MVRVLGCPCLHLAYIVMAYLYSYGTYNNGLYSYGSYDYGQCARVLGPHFPPPGIYSYGLHSHGLYSYGPSSWPFLLCFYLRTALLCGCLESSHQRFCADTLAPSAANRSFRACATANGRRGYGEWLRGLRRMADGATTDVNGVAIRRTVVDDGAFTYALRPATGPPRSFQTGHGFPAFRRRHAPRFQK